MIIRLSAVSSPHRGCAAYLRGFGIDTMLRDSSSMRVRGMQHKSFTRADIRAA